MAGFRRFLTPGYSQADTTMSPFPGSAQVIEKQAKGTHTLQQHHAEERRWRDRQGIVLRISAIHAALEHKR
jgi:hypothetical protein